MWKRSSIPPSHSVGNMQMRPEAAAGEALRCEQVARANLSAQGPEFSLWDSELRAARLPGNFLGWGVSMTSGGEELDHPAP